MFSLLQSTVEAVPHISTPLKQALAANRAARFRLLNIDFMLMCEMDSNKQKGFRKRALRTDCSVMILRSP